MNIRQADGAASGTNQGDGVSLGAVPFGYYVTPLHPMTLDIAYSYRWENPARVEQEDSRLQPGYRAEFNNNAYALGGQIT